MTFSVIHFFLYIHSRWNFFFFNISGRNNSKISRNIKKNDTSNFFHQYELHKMSLKIEEIHIISFTFFFFENRKVGNTDFSKNLKKKIISGIEDVVRIKKILQDSSIATPSQILVKNISRGW